MRFTVDRASRLFQFSVRAHTSIHSHLWFLRNERISTYFATPQRESYKYFSSSSSSGDYESPDVLIVGSGAAGLSAALRCHYRGLRPLIVEKSSKIGGTSAWSGGGLWIPNNQQFKSRGIRDSEQLALQYLDNLIDEVCVASSPERRLAFVRNASKIINSLTEIGCKWVPTLGMPDYHGSLPGSLTEGRTIEPAFFDGKRLGQWRKHLKLPSLFSGSPMHIYEGGRVLRVKSLVGIRTLLKIVFRYIGHRALGREPLALGQSLTGQMLKLNVDRGTQIWLATTLRSLTTNDEGHVIGAVVQRDGKDLQVNTKAAILSAGGFAKNDAMRKQYQLQPTDIKWSSASPEDTGEVIQIGTSVGAATTLMDASWWNPSYIDPRTGTPYLSFGERSRPGSIIVDSSGKRFMNEAESYNDNGTHQYERNKTVPAVPAWLIMDTGFRGRQPLFTLGPQLPRKRAIAAGFLNQASSLEELAKQININAEGLKETVKRFNGFAKTGRDLDFGRGETAFDHMNGDKKIKPNPNLGPISKPPFFAVRVYPGDLGTKGGLVTDEHARVLDDHGKVIEGLYAAGNTSASVMGRKYAGAGATLGPAIVFASLAVDHVAGTPWTDKF